MLKHQDSSQLRQIFEHDPVNAVLTFYSSVQRLFDLEKMLLSDTQTQNVI